MAAGLKNTRDMLACRSKLESVYAYAMVESVLDGSSYTASRIYKCGLNSMFRLYVLDYPAAKFTLYKVRVRVTAKRTMVLAKHVTRLRISLRKTDDSPWGKIDERREGIRSGALSRQQLLFYGRLLSCQVASRCEALFKSRECFDVVEKPPQQRYRSRYLLSSALRCSSFPSCT